MPDVEISTASIEANKQPRPVPSAGKAMRIFEWLSKCRIGNRFSIAMTYVCYGWAVLQSFLTTAMQFAKPVDKPSDFYEHFVKWAVNNSFYVYVGMSVFLLCAVGVKWMAKILAPACDDEAIRSLLSEAVAAIVYDWSDKDLPNRVRHRYRATLFKYRQPCFVLRIFLGCRWAGVVARSDDSYRHSKAIFLINDADPDKSTGIIGLCHKAEGQALCFDLPDPDADRIAYLNHANMSDKEFGSLKIVPRSCVVNGVKTKGGKLWGAVIFDTDDPRPMATAQRQGSSKRVFGLLSTSLTHFIQ